MSNFGPDDAYEAVKVRVFKIVHITFDGDIKTGFFLFKQNIFHSFDFLCKLFFSHVANESSGAFKIINLPFARNYSS